MEDDSHLLTVGRTSEENSSKSKCRIPGRCTAVLDLIGELYEIKREAKGRSPDEVLALRKERSKQVILAIQKWALEAKVLPESILGRAI